MRGIKKIEIIKKTSPPKTSGFRRFLYLGGISKKEMLFFTKHLSVMLKAGSTLTEALAVLKNQSKGKLQIVLNEIAGHAEKGFKFSEALEKHPKIFSKIYINMIRVGEESGALEKNLEYLAEQLEKDYDLRQKVIGAMIYPVIIIVGTLILGFSIAIFVLPKIGRIFKTFKVELPLATRILLHISDFFQNYGWWAVFGSIGSIIFLFLVLRLKFLRPFTHYLILKVPIAKSIAQHSNLAIFARTLGILLKGGITIDEAVKICSGITPNYYYKKFLAHVFGRIKAGDPLAAVLSERKKLFTETDIQIINVGEESGTLTESLNYCASLHEREVDNITRNLTTILEPVLLIVIGLLVGFLALSIITPIYSITGQFRR